MSELEDPTMMERRIFLLMCVTVALAVLVSTPLAPWRVTTGLFIGGALSLLNYHWLKRSIANAFDSIVTGTAPKVGIGRYVLRYLIVGATITAAHLLDIASLVAMLFGLCSFVVAALAEAFMQTYFVIIKREGN